jgi:hypothetical protein
MKRQWRRGGPECRNLPRLRLRAVEERRAELMFEDDGDQCSQLLGSPHSYRSATMGSTLVARRAGM